jgi:hypothetical protein
MAWPAAVAPGDTATSAQYNAVLDGEQNWGGNVDAGNHDLLNLASLHVNAGGVTTPLLKVTTGAHTLTITDRGDGYVLHRDDSGFYLFGQYTVDTSSQILVGGQNTALLELRRSASDNLQIFAGVGSAHHQIAGSGALDVNMPFTMANGASLYGAFTIQYKDSSNPAKLNLGNSTTNAWAYLHFDETSFSGYAIPTLDYAQGGGSLVWFGYWALTGGLNCSGPVHGVGEVAAFNANWAGTPGVYMRAYDANHGNRATIDTSSGQQLAIVANGGVCFTDHPFAPINGTWCIYTSAANTLVLRWFDSNGVDHVKQILP